MHGVPILLVVLAFVCEAFGIWGLHTVAGRHAFDEMAGLVPLAAMAAGPLLIVCAVVVWWRRRPAR